ncbi:UNVERIFIED_CONTAM: hypothetical protein DES50_10692 [Williamsia faeni]
MNDFHNAESVVDHAVMACASWHRVSPLATRPNAVRTAHAAALQPEFLAMTAAIPAPQPPTVVPVRRRARFAFPVFSQRIEI